MKIIIQKAMKIVGTETKYIQLLDTHNDSYFSLHLNICKAFNSKGRNH